jgi:hypothetical protein
MHRGPAWKISVYGREHGVPHFHIEGPDFRCSVGIRSLELIIGDAPADVLRAARDWARDHERALTAQWKALNP